jgi:hypothetical protein
MYIGKGNEINTAEDIKVALNSGDIDYWEKLDPKSASYGYHYWYNPTEQKIELATYDELGNANIKAEPIGKFLGEVTFPKARIAEGFEASSPRALKGYYFLDVVGENNNVIATFYDEIEKMSMDGADYAKSLKKLELSDNGKALKRLKAGVSIETEYDYNNGGYIELTTTLDGDDIKGAKIVAEINAANYDYKHYVDNNDGNGNISEYEVVCSTYRVEIEAKGFAEGENFEISATLDTTVDKVFEIKERYDYDTYETTILSKKEIDKEGHGQEIDAELHIALNEAQKKLDISFELVVDEMELNVEGAWLLTVAPNAGEVPAEITEYINSLN